jgi:uncharacterized protein (TIGR00251 family)
MLLYLKIKPNQRFDAVEGSAEQWVLRLKAPAVDGKANEHLVNYLSDILGLPKSKIQLKKGQTSRIKCLDIDASAEIVHQRLALESSKSAQ